MKINELKSKPSPEEEIRKKFGRVLFGEFQNRTMGLRKNNEDDTKYERMIFQLVSNWFYQVKGQNRDVFKALKELSQLKDHYPTILKPDPIAKYPKLYRALIIKSGSVKLKQMAKEYKDREDIEFVGMVNGYKVFKFGELHEYKPKRSVESWTTTLGNAVSFVKAWHLESMMNKEDFNNPEKNRMFIYEAEIPEEERLFKLRFTNKIFDYKESEVVRLGSKPVQATIYLAMKRPRKQYVGWWEGK